MLENEMTANWGYEDMDTRPRMIGDIDGDGFMDVVGIKADGVYVAKGYSYCSHSTRDPTNGCACRSGFYDAGDG